MQDLDASIARFSAARMRVLALALDGVVEIDDADGDREASRLQEIGSRSLTAEIAAATRSSERTVESELSDAFSLTKRFPATLDALSRGEIGARHVRVVLAEGGCVVDPEARAEYERRVLDRALVDTPARLRVFARRQAERVEPGAFEDRHRVAREQRRVWVDDQADGMSTLSAFLPSPIAHGIRDRLTEQARALAQGCDETRTFDQLRADLASDLLLAGEPATRADAPHTGARGVRAEVAITIPVLTLLGRSDEPATLDGVGPIGLDDARELAAEAPSLTRILTHPVTGAVLETDSYRPSADLRRHLRIRDRHCRFPGCRRSASRSDLDHTIDAQHGGPTTAENLATLCRRHHVLKHQSAWRVRQLDAGVLEWTSPAGHVYTDKPEPPPGPRFEPTAFRERTPTPASPRWQPTVPTDDEDDFPFLF